MSRIVLNGLKLAMVVLVAASGVIARDARALSDSRFVGNVGYALAPPTAIVLNVDRVENFNLFFTSGTLQLELWASLPGSPTTGYRLAAHNLGQLSAGSSFNSISATTTYTAPPIGTWNLTIYLTEYDGSRFVAVDSHTFSRPLVVAPPPGVLGFSHFSLTFPPQVAGTSSAAQTIVVRNTGGQTVSITSIAFTAGTVDFAFSTQGCGILAPNVQCLITVTFQPLVAAYNLQVKTGALVITSNGQFSPQVIQLLGTATAALPPGQLALASTLQFGNQTVGIARTQNVTISNTGGQAVTTSSVTVSGADFSGIPTGCATIPAGASCNVAVTFAPSATGNRIGTLNVVSNGVGSPQTMQLSGVGLAAVGPGRLLISGPLSFGNQTVGTSSAPKAINISNIGGQTVTTSSRTISGADFSGTQTGCLFIAAGSSCTVYVTFSPSVAGNRTGTLNIVSDGVGSPQSVQLNGVGVTTASPPSTTAAAIEYYHAAFDHYFVTAIADEITKLDNGTFVGWARTGRTFNVYTSTQSGLAAVCRFFSTTFAPKSSHFYTPDAPECSTVQANPNWQFEAVVFYMAKADVNGICPALTQPVYRLYNDGQGAAPNHRYTTDTTVRTQMLGQGWIPEGYGPAGVIMCAPL